MGLPSIPFLFMDFPGGSDGKASVYNVGDLGSSPGLGRFPGEGNGNPLHYYCLENPIDRGAWCPWGRKKLGNFNKASVSALLSMPKPLTVWITVNCGKFWKRWECQTTWTASWKPYMPVRKQQLELDMEQYTGSKWEKEYIKAVYCHPAYLTYMQST